jgi:prefoldin subunit 5
VSTFTTSSFDICYACRNTLSLQQTNLAYEVWLSTTKLKDIRECCKALSTIHFDDFRKQIDSLSQFDVHLKHLLLNEKSFLGLEAEIKKLTELLSSLPSTIHAETNSNETNTTNITKSLHSYDKSMNTLTQNIVKLQEDIQLLANPPATSQIKHESSSSATDKLLEEISKKLDNLCSDHSSVSADMVQMKQSIESVQTVQQQSLATSAPHAPSPSAQPPTEPSLPTVPPPPEPDIEIDHKQVPHSQIHTDFISSRKLIG